MTFPTPMANGHYEDQHGRTPPITHYSAPIDLSDSPSPPTKQSSPSIPIPGSYYMDDSTPIAGPSSEGAIYRRGSSQGLPPSPTSPSSAPAIPSVIAVAHPSLYIHTQHPRRGSMTPLGLHVISPVPPNPSNPSGMTPIRNVGFSPSYVPLTDSDLALRRGSTASSSSTLTQTRPYAPPIHAAYPAGFSRERRRSSLTPTLPTLVPASPTRAHVSGRIHPRQANNDVVEAPAVHARTRTADHTATRSINSSSPLAGVNFVRRGSMPHLQQNGGSGQTARTWNPTLSPQRGSLAEEATLPDHGFKFGSGAPGPSTAAAALKNLDISSDSRRSPGESRKQLDSFEETEAEEAERQRRAFLAATYGSDGKRARERLSFAGPGMLPQSASPATPSTALRRQSLMLWERINTAASAARLAEENNSLSRPPAMSAINSAKSLDDIGPRRGSLPLAIPNSGLGRNPSHRRNPIDTETDDCDVKAEDEEKSDSDFEEDKPENNIHQADENDNLPIPQRPLPPLLPLSDPGPRLLPSTLALHRANHLLNSRNLQADPLPHPLPPSLHPPAPVDFAEFDIDFILSGSQAQLGGDGQSSNDPVDVLNSVGIAVTNAPTFKLGRDDEDTFAKFVGEFDDEYGGRRGEWTFRACPGPQYSQSPSTRNSENMPRAEWDCSGGGKYELFSTGEVRSVKSGSRWLIRRAGTREYELEEKQKGGTAGFADRYPPPVQPSSMIHGDTYVLTTKHAHSEHGGAKCAAVYRPRLPFSPVAGSHLRVSINDQYSKERTIRAESIDSTATAKAAPSLSSSLPQAGNTLLAKARQLSKGERDHNRPQLPLSSLPERGRASMSGVPNKTSELRKKEKRSDSKDRGGDDDKKKGGGLGGALKRAFKSTIAANEEKKAAREEREREKMQSQSWSPSVSRAKDFVHPSGKGFADRTARAQTRTMPASVGGRYPSSRGTSLSSRTGSDASDINGPQSSAWLTAAENRASQPKMPTRTDSLNSDFDMASRREGKAWEGVSEEAVAMIIPIEEETSVEGVAQSRIVCPTKLWEGSRQALLVLYIPFNSDTEERPNTAASSTSSRHSLEPPVGINQSAQPSSSGSIPKFQKLLRRRASKERDALKREREATEKLNSSSLGGIPSPDVPNDRPANNLHPLPFRSFRVVARVVDVDDLRSQNRSADSSYGPFSPSRSLLGLRAPSSIGSGQSPSQVNPSLPSTDGHETSSSLSTAPTSNILQGRSFPTVIAVCHSRSQGVEFVMEGLDRLGFCQGDSAWGPTGYEEWRGSGLSERGRELLNLLWAGCVGVMGLTGV